MTVSRSQPSMAQRLQDHAASDHIRGCMGRQYSCSCEYDATTEKLLVEAAARITELESNEAAYESILGPRTYNEVAEHIWGLEDDLLRRHNDACNRWMTIKDIELIVDKSVNAAVYTARDALNDLQEIRITIKRAALSHAGPVAGK